MADDRLLEYELARLALCERIGVSPDLPVPGTITGIARNVGSNEEPLNGLRHSPSNGTNGWYVWAGEDLGGAADFFQPIHVEHLGARAERVLAYLALPPGWRFLIAADYEDVWFDNSLLDT